jgi:hypothetical protein
VLFYDVFLPRLYIPWYKKRLLLREAVAGSGLALDLTTEKIFLSYMIFFFG